MADNGLKIYKGRDIGRTVQLSYCKGLRVVQGKDTREACEFEAVVYGSISVEAAQAYFRRKFHDDTIVITGVETDTDYYSMDLETFLSNSTKRGQ